MTPENSSALPTFARTASEASPQTTSDATAIEAGLRDAPGSSRGSSGWSLTEPTDGAVHGAPSGGPARHSSTTPSASPEDAALKAAPLEDVEDTVAFWETQALRLAWETTPENAGAKGGKP